MRQNFQKMIDKSRREHLVKKKKKRIKLKLINKSRTYKPMSIRRTRAVIITNKMIFTGRNTAAMFYLLYYL